MSCSLADVVEPLVFDTSVLINLHACKYGEGILGAIPNGLFVPEIVARELDHETSRRNGEYGFIQSLVTNGVVMLGEMTDVENRTFQDLISTSPSLDDGEAATISIAASRSFVPIIDERKARALASTIKCMREPSWSLDVFRHPAAVAVLGDQSAIEALYFALRDGRMRIPLERVDEVIALIGAERARNCICLPGYRERFINIPS